MIDQHESTDELVAPERYELGERPLYQFDVSRREFTQFLGAGLLISWTGRASFAQQPRGRRRRGRRRDPVTIAQRLHVGADGTITVMTGKVEVGQGSRTQLTQAAAEELHVAIDTIRLVMADTTLVPNDGGTSGSQTTPRTCPAVRRAAATAREVLIELAAQRWDVNSAKLIARDGCVVDTSANRSLTYGELAAEKHAPDAFKRIVGNDMKVTPVKNWKVLGTPVARVGREDLVTGAHRFPSDIVRPGMLYGKVLRPASFGATLETIDLEPARAMSGVVVVRDGNFVGCAAPRSDQVASAVEAISRTAKWNRPAHPSSTELFKHLKTHASNERVRTETKGSIKAGLAKADSKLRAEYRLPYIAHVPMETRAAVAEWKEGNVTVWTGTQQPSRVRSEVARAFGIEERRVRVIVPDTGGGFGGKHTGEVALEAARLARAAKRPVKVNWTREEEFTWAYFRPAGVMEMEAGLDEAGRIVAWDFTNYNSGRSAIAPPYKIPNIRTRFIRTDSPLREGSYRALAATANAFARESFMDELAAVRKRDPLAYRLEHLDNERLRAVLTAAAEGFRWKTRRADASPRRGVGLACGIEKASYVAACAEVAVDRKNGRIEVRNVCQAFECGAIQNPANLRAQVEGCIIMGLGGALWEQIDFQNGKLQNPRLSQYRVPRFADLPEIETILLDRPDLPSLGGGETPIIAVAPAIANAVFHAAGIRLRSLPLEPALRQHG